MSDKTNKKFGVEPVIPDDVKTKSVLAAFSEKQKQAKPSPALDDLDNFNDEPVKPAPPKAAKPETPTEPKAKRKKPPQKAQVQENKNDKSETKKVNFSAGIPIGQVERVEAIAAKSQFDIDQLFGMLFQYARKNMLSVPLNDIVFEQSPKMDNHKADFQLQMPTAMLKAFREKFDPLDVIQTVEICRNFYVVAFSRALAELEAKI